MNRVKLSERHSRVRTRKFSRGQAIIESTCGLILFVLVAVGLCLGFLDVYAIMVNSQKVRLAADAAARVANEGRFWLGTYRPDFNAEAAQARAQAAANYVLAAQGLPPCTITQFDAGQAVQEAGSYFVCSHVQIRVPGLRLPFVAAGIPGIIDITMDSYSSESSFTPYAAMVLGFTDPSDRDVFGRPSDQNRLTRRIQIPVIGYGTQGGNGALSENNIGASGSAVPGGAYIGTEARVYGGTTTDTLVVHDVSSGSDVTREVPW